MHSAKKMEKNLVVEQEERDTLGNDVGFLLSSFKMNEWQNSVKTKVSAKNLQNGFPKVIVPQTSITYDL